MGEQLLPSGPRARKTSEDEADRRMIEEVRQISLREVGVGNSESRIRSPRHGSSGGDRESRAEEARRQRRRGHDRRPRDDTSSAEPNQATSPSSHETTDSRVRARQIEHQSSLRSLISSSDFDSSDIDEEVLRQIIDDLVKDGLDLDNLNAAQEEELTDRIANALRQGRRLRSEDSRPSASREPTQNSQRSERDQTHRRGHSRSSTAVDQVSQPSPLPVSRPHLLHTPPVSHGSRQRKPSKDRRQTSPAATTSSGRSSEARRSATGTTTRLSDATRLSDPTRTSNHHRHQLPSTEWTASTRASRDVHVEAARLVTETSHSSQPESTQSLDTPDHRREVSDVGRQEEEEEEPRGAANQIPKTTNNKDSDPVDDSISRTPRVSAHSTATTLSTLTPLQNQTVITEDSHRQRPPYPLEDPSTAQINSSMISSAERPVRSASSISCNRCNKSLLEQELHFNCPICFDGGFNLCLRCYRQGLGCLHWFGFGNAATKRHERQTPSDGYSSEKVPHHVLIGHRYIHMPPKNRAVGRESEHRLPNENNKILQSGVFCSTCDEYADRCYWKCELCNEGEWGFCHRCVNQGKCCSHPLLPIAHTSTKPGSDLSPSTPNIPLSIIQNTKLEPRPAFATKIFCPLDLM